ncbi:MAG: hypothetical protein HZB55_11990 [Deltaproteobacteria bacterium]|nr:hypothetical protein [Deltaproteobacteria bacterium]
MSPSNLSRCALTAALLLWNLPAWAGWETGFRGAADSNVTRSVDGAIADTYLYGSLGYSRDVPGDRRVDWTVATTLDGALYGKVTGLDFVALSVAPGLVITPRPGWTVALSPFLQGKAAKDSDQSALAWGARLLLQQQVGPKLYLGEHYTYTDSTARNAVFSYREHALGAYAVYRWTPPLWTELGYRFARGDSFRTTDAAAATGAARSAPAQGMGMGMGMGEHHSFGGINQDVFKETVTTHEGTATAGYAWTENLTTFLGYTLTQSTGSLGTSRSHLGFAGVTLRF